MITYLYSSTRCFRSQGVFLQYQFLFHISINWFRRTNRYLYRWERNLPWKHALRPFDLSKYVDRAISIASRPFFPRKIH